MKSSTRRLINVSKKSHPKPNKSSRKQLADGLRRMRKSMGKKAARRSYAYGRGFDNAKRGSDYGPSVGIFRH